MSAVERLIERWKINDRVSAVGPVTTERLDRMLRRRTKQLQEAFDADTEQPSVDWLDGRESCLIDGVWYTRAEGYEEQTVAEKNGCSWFEFTNIEAAEAASGDGQYYDRAVRILVPIDQHTEGGET